MCVQKRENGCQRRGCGQGTDQTTQLEDREQEKNKQASLAKHLGGRIKGGLSTGYPNRRVWLPVTFN